MNAVVEIDGLTLEMPAAGYVRPLLSDVSLRVERGRSVGIVGESGSGKSLLSKAILGDIPRDSKVSGVAMVAGSDVFKADSHELRRLRRRHISMVFQDPRASVNPVHRVGDYLTEQVRANGVSQTVAMDRAVNLLTAMRLDNAREILAKYPGELSGGMLQRVVIAGALMNEPDLLLCDEATTALDVTTQSEIVGILRDLVESAAVTLVFVTHDLELAGDLCDELCVLYAGTVLERGATRDVLESPRHPYTAALLRSTPRLTDQIRVLPTIPGGVLPLTEPVSGCVFASRCDLATPECESGPIKIQVSGNRSWRCIRSADDTQGTT